MKTRKKTLKFTQQPGVVLKKNYSSERVSKYYKKKLINLCLHLNYLQYA